jgi:hypothetical protein
MELQVVKKIHINKDQYKKIGAFLYSKEEDCLYQESPWWFPVQICVSGIKKKPICQVTPGFLRLPFILKGWVNHDILLREIELLHLVSEGKILMHGSCAGNTLIVGLSNSGKTYQTYKAVSDGAALISEEYTIIHEKTAFPYKKVMRSCLSEKTIKDCKIKISLREKIWLFLSTIRAKLCPVLYEAVIWKEFPVSGQGSEIKKIVYGSTVKEVKNWKDFAILCENEFPFMANDFLQAYALVTGFDLIGLQEKQRKLIKEFIHAVYPPAEPQRKKD